MAAYGATDGSLEEKGGSSIDDEDEPVGFMETTAPYLAEFVGTFLIVFTMCCSNVEYSKDPKTQDPILVGDPMWNPTGLAFVVMVAVYSFGPISGGHLNPAVTLTIAFLMKFPLMKTLCYISAQVLGAFAGTLACWGIFHKTVQLGPPDKSSFEWYDVGIIEAVYTFMLCFVFSSCVLSKRNNKASDQNHFFGLAVGFVYIAGGYPSQDITGGIFNPAASLALGTMSKHWYWLFIYAAVQVAGAWVAALTFAIVRPEDFEIQHQGTVEDYEKDGVPVRAKLWGELVGTFVIVLTVGLNLVMVSPAGPWSFAACYMCFIYSLYDVSGGHFNPAVTLAVWLRDGCVAVAEGTDLRKNRREKCSFALAQSLIVNQLLGAVGAGFVYAHFNLVGAKKSWPLEPQNGYGWVQAGTAETIFTMVLAWVYLSVATTTMPPSTTKTNFYFGLAAGSCITIGGFAIGNVAGWNMNPAVAIGRGVAQVVSLLVIKNVQDWAQLLHCFWYAGFEMAGGLIAAMLFFMTHQREYMKDGSGFPHIA